MAKICSGPRSRYIQSWVHPRKCSYLWTVVLNQKFRASMNPAVPSQRISREADISIKRNILHRYLILQPSLSNEKHRNHAAYFKPKELARCTMLFYLHTGNNYSKFGLSRHPSDNPQCLQVGHPFNEMLYSSATASKLWGFVQKFWNLVKGLYVVLFCVSFGDWGRRKTVTILSMLL